MVLPLAAMLGFGGSLLGFLGGAADRRAQQRMADQAMAPYRMYEPYVRSNLAGSQQALNNALAQGAYSGPTYAGPNALQTGTANRMGEIGTSLQNSGFGLTQQAGGFGQNATSLYDQYQGMAQQAQQDRLGNAIDYAAANTGPLLEAAMRDDRRQLTEQTLPGVNLAASASGNMNSSRAGVAEAIAQRSYDDRRADVAADIQQQLIDRSLNQQNRQFADQGSALQGAGQANSAMQSAYNTGLNTIGQGGNFGMNAGEALQGYDQAALNAQREAYERARDFELQQRQAYQAGILGRAPTSTNPQPVTASPLSSGIGGGLVGLDVARGFGLLPNNGFPTSFISNPFMTQRMQ